MQSGPLIVLEGSDGVGKSELASRFHTWFQRQGKPSELMFFPGKQEGTLGKLVYDLHLDSTLFGVTTLSAASLQALHIAAHIDAIERRILPTLKSGRAVILDRFWWSTYVYGIVDGAKRSLLERLIDVEKTTWGVMKPNILFLIDRDKPLRPEPIDKWQKWRAAYLELLSTEKVNYPCELIANQGKVEESEQLMTQAWNKLREQLNGSQR